MSKNEQIVAFYRMLRTFPEQKAYIIALELCGENLLANKCKEFKTDFTAISDAATKRALDRIRNSGNPYESEAIKRIDNFGNGGRRGIDS